MKNNIGILLGEPNSINYEIFFKSINFIKDSNKKFFIVGSFKLLKENFKINLSDFNKTNIKNLDKIKKINFIDIDLTSKTNTFLHIRKCFDAIFYLLKKNKIKKFINLPVDKSKFTKFSFPGVTEYLGKQFNILNTNMLIYNEKFSVMPISTHIPIKAISKSVSFHRLNAACQNIYNFYKKTIKKKIKIGVLGLNPHNGDNGYIGDEEILINKWIKKLKKKYSIYGPIPPDTSFIYQKKNKVDILVGWYHDQIITTFKTLFGFNAINITLGLPFLRVSPDHGTAKDIIGKNLANNESFIKGLKFLFKYRV